MTQRDWQKDMDKITRENERWEAIGSVPIELDISTYWLQEAKEQKERADRVTEERLRFNQVYEMLLKKFNAADTKEQRLKELLSDALGCLVMSTSKDNEDVARIAAEYRTLYPDTPAPKEGNADASLD